MKLLLTKSFILSKTDTEESSWKEYIMQLVTWHWRGHWRVTTLRRGLGFNWTPCWTLQRWFEVIPSRSVSSGPKPRVFCSYMRLQAWISFRKTKSSFIKSGFPFILSVCAFPFKHSLIAKWLKGCELILSASGRLQFHTYLRHLVGGFTVYLGCVPLDLSNNSFSELGDLPVQVRFPGFSPSVMSAPLFH